eukprot:NODE_16566_length_987_cov_13.023256.p1 GENE.NODE_16566_length_987_cov_13.023256~~NODE_16566_length_987_cov_13.023256.p1  ORF type:complete len:195 (-),score=50.86 NODE_16566_length_987_cov_13.023256:401-907(-)
MADRLNAEVGLLPRHKLRGLIVDMAAVPWIDVTASLALKDVMKKAESRDVPMFIAQANEKTQCMIVDVCSVDEAIFYASIRLAEKAVKDGERLRLKRNSKPAVHVDALLKDEEELRTVRPFEAWSPAMPGAKTSITACTISCPRQHMPGEVEHLHEDSTDSEVKVGSV